MNKNKIKSFAMGARRSLIDAISNKARKIGITEKKIENAATVEDNFGIFEIHRDELVKEVKEKGFQKVMEDVSYTWFMRFVALRYMEVNEYLPSGIRVLSSTVVGKTEPDVLTKISEAIEKLNLNSEYVRELLGSGKVEDREEAYKYILIKQCNKLGEIIPQMFQKISDYREMLLPDNLLEEGSVIRKIVKDIEESYWKEEVEIIGWMHQYYMSEKKDEVFASLKENVKITKENIPAATQLFTPKWIVKYMVENSLGRLWLEGHPDEEAADSKETVGNRGLGLKDKWKYYLEEAKQEIEVEEELKKIREEHGKLKPEDIKVLDPCMGSGNILVYAFDVLYEIYKTEGYKESQIPKMILKYNLYGLDIDDRAVQLASFVLIMKAREFNKNLFREMGSLELNLCSIQESNLFNEQLIDYFCNVNGILNEQLKNDFQYLIEVFIDAKEYGSILEVKKVNFEMLKRRLNEIEKENALMVGDYKKIFLDKFYMIIKQAEIMSKKYEVCVTNPPYMVSSNMNDKLKAFIDKNYADMKEDIYAVFIKRAVEYSACNKYIAMITRQSWMFLKSFKEFRSMLINEYLIENLLHLGSGAFEEINGEVVQCASFIIKKYSSKEYNSIFFRLNEVNNFGDKEDIFLKNKIYNSNNIKYIGKNNRFNNIKYNPLAYKASEKVIDIYNKNKSIGDICSPKQGLVTGDVNKFTRKWFEVSIEKIHLYDNSKINKWFIYNNGGKFRKWYGNNEDIVLWENDGYEIKNFRDLKGRLRSRPQNSEYYFREGATWTAVTTNALSLRYFPKGMIFSNAGMAIFGDKNELPYIISFLNSKPANYLVSVLNEGLNFNQGDIKRIPYISNLDFNDKIFKLYSENLKISKTDWDSFETSWDFKIHPLLLVNSEERIVEYIADAFDAWRAFTHKQFKKLKANEEELNRIFIDIYGLQDELNPEVDDKDITIRKAERERDIKSFISYAVGCMFGRYSIDAAFVPNGDNVIPITEDEYFDNDIVSKFIEFVRISYSEETLEKNLNFIADSIGRRSSETARETIRRYFVKEFYKNHLKIYEKRPIYWMFESGKNNGFKALIYMHRYNLQTIATLRINYLHILQKKYEAELKCQQLIIDSEEYTAKDKIFAVRKIDRIIKQLEECKEYDKVLAYMANKKISIDLDDGVRVNYEKFQRVKFINSEGEEAQMDLLAKLYK